MKRMMVGIGVIVWLLNAGNSGIFRKGGRKER